MRYAPDTKSTSSERSPALLDSALPAVIVGRDWFLRQPTQGTAGAGPSLCGRGLETADLGFAAGAGFTESFNLGVHRHLWRHAILLKAALQGTTFMAGPQVSNEPTAAPTAEGGLMLLPKPTID